jgi:hypothetical protein
MRAPNPATTRQPAARTRAALRPHNPRERWTGSRRPAPVKSRESLKRHVASVSPDSGRKRPETEEKPNTKPQPTKRSAPSRRGRGKPCRKAPSDLRRLVQGFPHNGAHARPQEHHDEGGQRSTRRLRPRSTRQQDLALQLDALNQAGCERIFRDVGSGTLRKRPQLDACLEYLRSGDTLVVWRLDRLGRSLRHLVDVIAALVSLSGVIFTSCFVFAGGVQASATFC